MFCRKCGAENNEGANFCRSCGEAMQGNVQKSNKREKSGRLYIVIPSVLLLCVGIVMAIFLLKDNKRVGTKEFQKNMEAGQKYLEEMDYEQAAACFNKAIDIDPKQIDAYQSLANAYVGMGDYEKADTTYEKAVTYIQEEYENEDSLPEGSEALFTEATKFYAENDEVESNWKLIEQVGQLTEDEEEKEEIAEKRDQYDREQAYYDLILEYQTQYGEGTMKTIQWNQYLAGLCFARLLDFNQDGMDELILAYSTTGEEIFPPKYKIEVWDYKNKEMTKVYSGDPYTYDGGTSCLYITCVEEMYYIATGAADSFKHDYIWGYSGENFEQAVALDAVFGEEASYTIDGGIVTIEEYEKARDKWWAEFEEYDLFRSEEKEQDALAELNQTIETLEKLLKIEKTDESKTEETAPEVTQPQGEEYYKNVLDAYREANRSQFTSLDGYYVMEGTELKLVAGAGEMKLYYSLDDIDGNGMEELFIGASDSSEEIRIYDIWAFDGVNAVRFIDNYTLGYRNNCIPCNNGILKFEWSSGAMHYGLQYCTISEDGYTCATVENISDHEGKFYHSMDESDEISEEEFNQIRDSYTERTLEWKELT